MANTKTISIVVPEEIYDKIKAEADEEYIGISPFVRRIIMRIYDKK